MDNSLIRTSVHLLSMCLYEPFYPYFKRRTKINFYYYQNKASKVLTGHQEKRMSYRPNGKQIICNSAGGLASAVRQAPLPFRKEQGRWDCDLWRCRSERTSPGFPACSAAASALSLGTAAAFWCI